MYRPTCLCQVINALWPRVVARKLDERDRDVPHRFDLQGEIRDMECPGSVGALGGASPSIL